MCTRSALHCACALQGPRFIGPGSEGGAVRPGRASSSGLAVALLDAGAVVFLLTRQPRPAFTSPTIGFGVVGRSPLEPAEPLRERGWIAGFGSQDLQHQPCGGRLHECRGSQF